MKKNIFFFGMSFLIIASVVFAVATTPKPLPNSPQQQVTLCVATGSSVGTPAILCVEKFNTMSASELGCDDGEKPALAGCSYDHTTCTLPNGNPGRDCTCIYMCVKTAAQQ